MVKKKKRFWKFQFPPRSRLLFRTFPLFTRETSHWIQVAIKGLERACKWILN